MKTKLLAVGAVVLLGAASRAQGAAISMTYGYLRSTTCTVLFVAKEKGLFDEEGLDVTLKEFTGGAPVTVATVSKSIAGGLTGASPFLIGAQKKLPIVAVSDAGHTQAGQGDLYMAILVKTESPIQGVGDLKGKRVATNTFGASQDLLLRVAAARVGLDATRDMKVVEVPFPEQLPALLRGDIDAAFSNEPHITRALAGGKVRPILKVTDVIPRFQISVFTMGQWFIEAHPEAPRRFNQAILRAARWVRENEREARDIVARWTGLPPDVAQRTILPSWDERIDVAGLRQVYDLMRQSQFISGTVDFDKVIYKH